ncbi:MAG: DUF3574 domain-containing protein [Parvibaculum sp.]|uniref:DUF3574 domain-containing protein n=1 Tax=Parvibaculum sp. TaxID=2024848 RepID=UPI0025E52BB0|nr:DUF3574 domain-containing protein [Parvibaculum sp.]MCE9650723.1 DUF3574 domain-containing protein [Parvibaculum sp.]
MRRIAAIFLLSLVLIAPAFAGSGAVQTTLYFGLSLPKGGVVSEKQWSGFLADTVSPRFPDGLTVVSAVGQWRDPKSKPARTVSEKTKILILVRADTPAAEKAVAEIKAVYLKRFHQISVLQTDQPVRIVE